MSVESEKTYQPVAHRTGETFARPDPEVLELRDALKMSQAEADDHLRMVGRLREGLQEIYRLRGEDAVIARIASPLIDASRA